MCRPFFPEYTESGRLTAFTSAMSVDAMDADLNGLSKEIVRDLFTVITIGRTIGCGCEVTTVGQAIAKTVATANPNDRLDRPR